MFAPKMAKPQIKDAMASANSRARQYSTLTAHRHGPVPPGHDEQEADPASLIAREATPRVSWDFSRVPIFAPDRVNRAQARSAPPLSGIIQPMLAVGPVDDPLEREADRIADHVMRMPAPDVALTAPERISRKCATCEEEEKLQKKEAWTAEAATGESRRNSATAGTGNPWHKFKHITAAAPPTASRDDTAAKDKAASAKGDSGAKCAASDRTVYYPSQPPRLVPPLVPPPMPRRRCEIGFGPVYSPKGSIPVYLIPGENGKRATFKMSAVFVNDAAAGKIPACCEFRQFFKWDKIYHHWHGGPPHPGLPSSAAPDTWIEDRDPSDKLRYGHRSGPHAVAFPGCGNEYKAGPIQDMLYGDTYCGDDNPTVHEKRSPSQWEARSETPIGQWQFQSTVIDTCHGDFVVAWSPVITVNWAP